LSRPAKKQFLGYKEAMSRDFPDLLNLQRSSEDLKKLQQREYPKEKPVNEEKYFTGQISTSIEN